MPPWLSLAIDSFWPMLYAGVTFTIPLTLISFALGLSLGFIVAWHDYMARSHYSTLFAFMSGLFAAPRYWYSFSLFSMPCPGWV